MGFCWNGQEWIFLIGMGMHIIQSMDNATTSDSSYSNLTRCRTPSTPCSYYALEGGTGSERWHHNSTDFHRDLDELADETQPQNNYK